MKKALFPGIIACLLPCMSLFSQTKITDKNFTQLTPFVAINKDKANMSAIALGKVNEAGKTKYCLLMENTYDYGVTPIDTTGLTVTLETYFSRKTPKLSWCEDQETALRPSGLQPTSNTKGKVVSLYLPDSTACDLKNQILSSIKIENETYKNKMRSASSEKFFSLPAPAKSFFITNSAKITAAKGSFDDISKFKVNKIPLYSLMLKKEAQVEARFGKPVSLKDTYNDQVIKTYTSEHGRYEIIYKKDSTVKEINMYPKYRFKYIGPLFVINKVPYELTGCNCGDARVEEGHETIYYHFKDKRKHAITFRRTKENMNILDRVTVEED
jgi:hypothetical protein